MKILCPTDFTAPSRDGLAYAASLARVCKGSLTLFHVQPSIWPEAMQLRNEVERSMDDIRDELELYKNEVITEFGIPCDWKFQRTTDTVEGSVSSKAQPPDLIVMGTNGADSLYQHMFGSNTFNVIADSKCPVIMVPEGTAFREVKRMVYAFDPETNPIFLVEQLKKIAEIFRAQVEVIHVVTGKKSEKTEHRMEILQQALAARNSSRITWQFHYTYDDDVTHAIDKFMRQTQAELLVITYHYRSLAQKLFRPNVIKRLSMVASYPTLVIHK